MKHSSGKESSATNQDFDHLVTIVRSGRKTVGLQVTPDGTVIVRAPYHLSDRRIREILEEKASWIRRHLQMAEEEKHSKENTGGPALTDSEIRQLAEQALKTIPPKVARYAKELGVTYGRITIRNQKTRWGSCSSKGNLNFNCLLMLAPERVLDSVIVHELCHRKEMNHSRRFYEEVYRVFPDYDECRAWLKTHGGALLRRMNSGNGPV